MVSSKNMVAEYPPLIRRTWMATADSAPFDNGYELQSHIGKPRRSSPVLDSSLFHHPHISPSSLHLSALESICWVAAYSFAMEDHSSDDFLTLHTELPAGGLKTPPEIPDLVDEYYPTASDSGDQKADPNPAHARTIDIGEELYASPQMSSSNDIAADPGAYETIPARTTDAQHPSQPTLMQGSMTLIIGEWEHNHNFDLRDTTECQDRLEDIAPYGTLTTQDFVRDALEAIMPDSFASLKMQVAVRLASFVLRLASGMFSDDNSIAIEYFIPQERIMASRISSRIKEDIPRLKWHGKTTCFGQVQYLIKLLERSLHRLAVPTRSLGREVQQDGAGGTAWRTFVAAVDQLRATLTDVCGAWAAENLFAAPVRSTPPTEAHTIVSLSRALHCSTEYHTPSRYQKAKSDTSQNSSDTIVLRPATSAQADPIGHPGPEPEEEELPPISHLLQRPHGHHAPTNVADGRTSSSPIVLDDTEPEPDTEHEQSAANAASSKVLRSKKRKSLRDNSGPVHYCTECHPQDPQLSAKAGGKKCSRCGTYRGKKGPEIEH